MKGESNFSVRMDPATRRQLDHIARTMERKPGDVVRQLIRKEAKRINKTAPTSATLAGGEVDAASASAWRPEQGGIVS